MFGPRPPSKRLAHGIISVAVLLVCNRAMAQSVNDIAPEAPIKAPALGQAALDEGLSLVSRQQHDAMWQRDMEQAMFDFNYLQTVQKEDIHELLANLNEPLHFRKRWVADPLFEHNNADILIVLNDRRTLRAYMLLSDVPQDQAATLCKSTVASMLAYHNDTISFIIGEQPPNLRADAPKSVSELLDRANASRLGLSCALWLATQFCAPDYVHEQMAATELAEERLTAGMKRKYESPAYLEHVAQIRRNDPTTTVVQLDFMVYCGIQPRFKLNLYMQAFSEGPAFTPALREALMKRFGLCAETITFGAWNAGVNAYDVRHRRDGLPVDLSQGRRDVVIYAWETHSLPLHDQAAALHDILRQLRP